MAACRTRSPKDAARPATPGSMAGRRPAQGPGRPGSRKLDDESDVILPFVTGLWTSGRESTTVH